MYRLESMAVRCAAVPVRLMTMEDAELADQMEMVRYYKHRPLLYKLIRAEKVSMFLLS